MKEANEAGLRFEPDGSEGPYLGDMLLHNDKLKMVYGWHFDLGRRAVYLFGRHAAARRLKMVTQLLERRNHIFNHWDHLPNMAG
jgi:hypothetical protein